jgi:hypothetical protein
VARKKIVFVIVEGPSDSGALSLALTKFYDKQTVYVHVMHQDITTQQGVTPTNIVTKIADAAKQYAKTFSLKNTDFQAIIHLVDTDGAYIPDDAIVEDPAALDPVYSTTEIRTKNKAGIAFRNACKRSNMDRLVATNSVWSIPYKVYYMSCNLDHVLYNKLNSTDEEKETDAHAFAKQYKDDLPGFLAFVSGSEFSVVNGYKESWSYIRDSVNSLERHTNFGLSFLKEQKTDTESQ